MTLCIFSASKKIHISALLIVLLAATGCSPDASKCMTEVDAWYRNANEELNQVKNEVAKAESELDLKLMGIAEKHGRNPFLHNFTIDDFAIYPDDYRLLKKLEEDLSNKKSAQWQISHMAITYEERIKNCRSSK